MKIRRGVFETNSSSTHSLSIDEDATLTKQPFSDEEVKQGYVEVMSGEFGWQERTYHNVHEKLSYLFTSASHDRKGKIDDQGNYDPNTDLDNDKLNMIRNAVKAFTGLDTRFEYNPDGYIDHQSSGVPEEVFCNVRTVVRFLFSNKSYFKTDNDNK